MDFYSFSQNITRKKDLTADMMRKELKKVLTLSDLTFLTISSMIGSGLYVLTGTVARNVSGPSIVVSYIIAAIASGFSAICYAEFAARIPITGSAYQFTYVCIGEIWAFIVGWAVYIEHVVVAAAIARAWSGYVDGMFGHPVKKYLEEHTPLGGGIFATYPDFVAAGLIVIMTIIVACGVKISSKFNIFFAILNLFVITFIICTGFYLGRIEYWTEAKFLPFGWSGTISGAATLIFSYVGYEVIACATEEAVRPKRDVPLSLFIGLLFVVIAYVGASTSLTLIVPWYNISETSPFPSAYVYRDWNWAQYIISIGAVAAMTAALLAAMIVVPRYLYAMARDGLLLLHCAKVHEKTGVPIFATFACGVLCLLCTLLFGLITLVEFIAIGQLTANTFVSICVIKLRYEPNCVASYEILSDDVIQPYEEVFFEKTDNVVELHTIKQVQNTNTTTNLNHNKPKHSYQSTEVRNQSNQVENTSNISSHHDCGIVRTWLLESRYRILFYWTLRYSPGSIPFKMLLLAIVSAIVLCVMFFFGIQHLLQWWFILLLILFFTITLLSVLFITAFNQDKNINTFKVPLVPFVPFISIVINIILMLKLKPFTWIRYGIWLGLGLVLYALYGYRHSLAKKNS